MTPKKKNHRGILWYKDTKWIISTIIIAFIGPIIVGFFLLYLGNKFNKSLENIKDQLFIKYSNAPQIWGYDPVEFSTDNIFHDFQFEDKLIGALNYNKGTDAAVQYLWADPYSNRKSHNLDKMNGGFAKISANISEDNSLRVKFVNTGWGTNITIKNKYSQSTCVRDFKNIYLKFRSPNKDSVGIRIRIVDFDNVHWAYGKYQRDKFGKIKLDNNGDKLIEYSKKDKNNNELISDSDLLTKININLKKTNWVHFCYDGVKEINSKIAESPFVMINFIIIEVGFEYPYSNLVLQHDMTGFYLIPNREGVIDIAEIGFE